MTVTITEALAELKLIKAKVEKKKAFVMGNLGRQEGAKDQLEKSGGTRAVVTSELQAIGDLHERIVRIRSAIAAANSASFVEIRGVRRSIADWLVWRRDVAPMVRGLESNLASGIAQLKQKAQAQGYRVNVNANEALLPTDVIIELDEKALADKAEATQEILDTLDGKLSLHNATVQVEAA